MTDTKWTPGPWVVDADNDIVGSFGYMIADLLVMDGNPSDEDRANAHLISASPELADLVKDARDLIAGDLVDGEWKRACRDFIKRADAVLAKALGEQ